DGEGRTTGEADAGVIAGAGVRVDAEALADHTLAFLDGLLHQRTDAPLAIELTLALGNDHLGATKLRRQRLTQHLQSVRHIVGPGMPHPLHADAADGIDDRVVPLPVLIGPAR